MAIATAHNGDDIYFATRGSGPAVMLFNANPRPPEHPARERLLTFAEGMVAGLADRFQVVLPAYPETPKDGTLTPDAVTADLLAIADAAGADHFAFWGHSWGGVIGLQLAAASDRVTALAVSGFPPIDGPYAAMLDSVRALSGHGGDLGLDISRDAAAEFRQFVTYYEGLTGFDDRAAHEQMTMPKLYFVGRDDTLSLGHHVIARFGDTVLEQQDELEGLGWQVVVVPDRDHVTLIDPEAVLPVLAPFLDQTLRRDQEAQRLR